MEPASPPPEPRIRVQSWRSGRVQESLDVEDLRRLVSARGTRTWIDLTDPPPSSCGPLRASSACIR